MTGPATRAKSTAKAIAKALKRAGYDAKVIYQDLAVKISDAEGKELATLWMPSGETAFNDLGDKYLWGKTGDEHQAPDYTGVNDLVQLVARTLQ